MPLPPHSSRIEGKGNPLIEQGKLRHSRAVDFHPFQLLTVIERIGMQHTVIMKAVLQIDTGKLLTFGKCQLIYFAYLLRTGQVCDIAGTKGMHLWDIADDCQYTASAAKYPNSAYRHPPCRTLPANKAQVFLPVM